jgi:iron only hydrogenase large subunit-like protein
MLASACPGWVCYAEKTQGPAVLPHISHTKSPQAGAALPCMGWAPRIGICPKLAVFYSCAPHIAS